MEWTKLFKGFFESEKTGGLLLLACTAIALVIANASWGTSFNSFWHLHLDASFAGLELDYTIEQWINDGLMTIFFLLAGLEIEREFYCGELSNFSNAVLPFVAALGGMVVPALIHFGFNAGTATQGGFGIPMATDIAFALGMLSLASNRVPYSLKIFLTALAIIDDIGAIIVIALFYNTGIHWVYLLLSAGLLTGLVLLSKLKVYRLTFYLLPGLVIWYCMMKSGIHPTIAGVLLAFVIPFSGDDESKPSYKLQSFLHKPVAYFIVPLFALANTGIVLHSGWVEELSSRNSLGIITGLVVGKPVGILLFSGLLIYFTKTQLPDKATWKNFVGVAVLAGIGFTMSIFISNLAFKQEDISGLATIAVLTASLIATAIGLVLLFNNKR